jgi:hypothetical protein
VIAEKALSSRFLTNFDYAFFLSHTRYIGRPFHCVWFNISNIFGKVYKLHSVPIYIKYFDNKES